ncbi:hypothetical protein E4582_09615 [Luteimonas yindakuii]|uniref:Uncharacterized protein n=1 Tax=Luteimonas yindakuii TaxID=2565782 RepID=A0A4Z1R5U1_9GAMM|nr:hypothetical protein [Luteimonas yindakuii]TKS54992.1 hypothetical protein E4582_09615 [Luteimonas yindakuii]
MPTMRGMSVAPAVLVVVAAVVPALRALLRAMRSPRVPIVCVVPAMFAVRAMSAVRGMFAVHGISTLPRSIRRHLPRAMAHRRVFRRADSRGVVGLACWMQSLCIRHHRKRAEGDAEQPLRAHAASPMWTSRIMPASM